MRNVAVQYGLDGLVPGARFFAWLDVRLARLLYSGRKLQLLRSGRKLRLYGIGQALDRNGCGVDGVQSRSVSPGFVQLGLVTTVQRLPGRHPALHGHGRVVPPLAPG